MLGNLLLITLVPLFTYSTSKVKQDYYFYQTRTHIDQSIGGYLIYFEGELTEQLETHKDPNNQVYIEKLIPVEFKHRLEDLKATTSIQLELGYGNNYLLEDIPEIRHQLNHGGTTITINSHSEDDYRTIVKIFAGTFDTEMERALNNYSKLTDINSKPFIYHNNGENPMNYIMIRRITEFFKMNGCFAAFSLLNILKSFEADYITFTLNIHLTANEIKLEVRTGFHIRNFLVDHLFNSLTYNAPKGSSPIIIHTNKKIVVENHDYIASSQLTRYIKDAHPLYYYKAHKISSLKTLRMINYIIKPFSSLNNRLVQKLTNLSFNNKMTVRLFLSFSHREMPILSKSAIKCLKGRCNVLKKLLFKPPVIGFNPIPAQTLIYDIELDIRAEIEFDIYYEFISENFEALTSNYNINYIIPASFAQFKLGSDETIYEKRSNNIAYKGKAYDSTAVFAIISVYIVVIFTAFNGLISLTNDKKNE